MRKKLAVLAVALAALAFALVPAAAQAEPHWYKGKFLVGSGPVPTATSGTLNLKALGLSITCKVKDTEEIWNPVSGGAGEDLMTAFTLSGCKNAKPGNSACPPGAVEVLANGLPWPSRLVSVPPGPVIHDEIMKMRLEVRCFAGTTGDEFEGTLSPEVIGNNLVFGPGSGTLLDSFLNPMTVIGKDKLVALPGKIGAKDP